MTNLVALLRENQAIKLIKRWLRRKYPEEKGYKVVCKMKGKGADCTVKRKGKRIKQIEVKGSKGDVYAGLGQCMCYFYDEHVETYLAVPYDWKTFGKEQVDLSYVKEVMDYNKVKFGLLKIKENGHTEIMRKARA